MNLRDPSVRLPDSEYEVKVTAVAGEISSEAIFTLRNQGTHYTDLALLA